MTSRRAPADPGRHLAVLAVAGLLTILPPAGRAADDRATAARQAADALVERGKRKAAEAEAAKKPAERERSLVDARALFGEAGKAFAAIENQAVAEERKFAPKLDKGTKEYEERQRVRQQLLAARVGAAGVLYEIARTHPAGSAARKDNLAAAAQKFGEVYEKYSAMLAGLYARLEQARCYKELGQADKVFEMLDEPFAQPDQPPEFRALKTKALLLALQTAVDERVVQKYEDVRGKYLAWERSAGAVEAPAPDELQMMYFAAVVARETSKEYAGSDRDGRLYRERAAMARRLFERVAGVPGPWQAKARVALRDPELDGRLAQDAAPADFAEAREQGNQILDQVAAREATIRQKGRPVTEKEQRKLRAYRREALRYFRTALAMKPADLPLDDLNAVRYAVAYLSLACGENHDAAVMGEFLARAYPESAHAKAAARIALAAYGKLFDRAPAEDRSFEWARLQKWAEHVGRTWPNAPEADDAWLTAVRAAAIHGDLSQARQYLGRIAAASRRRGEAESLIGQALWIRYRHGRTQVAEAQTPQEKEDLKRTLHLSDDVREAEELLTSGVTRMRQTVAADETNVGYPLLSAVLSLAEVLLETGQAEKALQWLDDPRIGAMTLVAANAPVTQQGDLQMETCKTALRACVGNRRFDKAREVAGTIESRFAGEGDKGAGLLRVYAGLGRDLRQHLERLREDGRADEARKTAACFEDFFAAPAAEGRSPAFPALLWTGDALFSIGAGFDSPGAKDIGDAAKHYYNKAAETYEQILKRYREPGFAAPKGAQYSIKIRLARTYARLGRGDGAKFAAAERLLLEILRETPAMADAQQAAASMYQAWGDVRPEHWLVAIAGNAAHKEVWGWERLAARVRDRADFRELFHEARYNLALCRFNLAQGEEGDAKTATLREALGDIARTQTMSPDLGGKAWLAKFDTLARRIQTALGEKPAGLPPVDTRKPTAASET
jgi:hypothetical protein